MKITRKELIKKYIEFFKSKKHEEIPNSPLIPENDPTVLFTTAGMHPLVPFLLGQKHPLGKRLVNVQKCLRTGDIESVGDTYHHTFFEMLGNWSLGDYFKKEAIEWSFEFLTKVLKIPVERLAISCFAGDKDVEKDEEAAKIWFSLGIPKERIAFLGREDNWWGPAGKTGPCGPDTEMFYWKSKDKPPKKFNPKDENWVEIWNDVFMQYNKNKEGKYEELKQKNVDTGMGVERTLAVLNNLEDDYLTDCFFPLIKKLEEISGKKYKEREEETKAMRIIADHIKAACFILAEKIEPSNVEQGYVLRRLIRRAIRFGRILGIKNFTSLLVPIVIKIYPEYKHLKKEEPFITEQLSKEEEKFNRTIEQGLRIFDKLIKKGKLSGKDAFLLYQSYGFPIELTLEIAKEKNVEVDLEGYKKEEERHRELSRTASAGRFKSGLADSSEETTKLHTATHLLLAALKKVLKKPIEQKGSNITAERLRFDFSFDRKLTDEEIKKVEDFVNKAIEKKLPVIREEMSLEEAKKLGATGVFENKYGERVSVYTIKDNDKVISREICAGDRKSVV